MKKLISLLLMLMLAVTGAMAQADKVCGTYKAVQNGAASKVKIFKHGDGYRAQIFWVEHPKNEDGSIKLDTKNPDAAKRKTPMDKVILIDKVKYNAKDKTWESGKIYDPTSGKTYNVELSIKDAKTLTVKGKLGPFSKKLYWTRLD